MSDYSRTHQIVGGTVNVNATGDTLFFVPFANFQVVSCKISKATTSLGATSATFGLFTAPAGAGTAIVAQASSTLTPCTTSAKVSNCTIASTDLTSGTTVTGTPGGGYLYGNVGVAHGSAATVNVLLEIVRWP